MLGKSVGEYGTMVITMPFGWKKVSRKLIRKVKRINRSYQTHKEAARTLIHARLAYFNSTGTFTYYRVSIRDQRRCWGSCSSKGNLNFSYKLLFLPPCLRDYVILHELCHLQVLNHSVAFWTVLTDKMPDAVARATSLRQLERTYGTATKTLQKLVHQEPCLYCEAVVIPSSIERTRATPVVQ